MFEKAIEKQSRSNDVEAALLYIDLASCAGSLPAVICSFKNSILHFF